MVAKVCNGKDSFFVCMYASVVILTDRLGTLFVLLLERNCAFRWKDVSIRPNILLVDSFRMEQRVGNDVLECVSCLSWQSIRWSHDRSRQTLWCGEVWTIPHDVLRLWKGVSISVTPVYCCSFRPILVRVTIVLCAFVVSENPQLSVVL